MRKEAIASLLVILMLVAMGGYEMLKNYETDSETTSDGEETEEMEDEWDVYYVDSGDDLPACG